MKRLLYLARLFVVVVALASLPGCDDPQVYGSVGVSSGFSSWGGSGSSTRMHGSISVGGRIR